MIEVGKHEVSVAKTALSSTRDGAEQIVVQFEDDAHDTITAYLACTEAAWPYTEQKLINIGWNPTERGFKFEELNEDPSPCQGNQCQIVVVDDTYQGKTRRKVSFINPPGGLGVEHMEPTEAQAFAARLRARILGQPVPVQKVAPAKRKAQVADESDTPF